MEISNTLLSVLWDRKDLLTNEFMWYFCESYDTFVIYCLMTICVAHNFD